MTRELSEQEKEAKFEAWDNYLIANGVDVMIGERRAFDTGFTAGLEYQRARIDELVMVLIKFVEIGPGASWIIDYYGNDTDTVDKLDELIEAARAAIAKVRE